MSQAEHVRVVKELYAAMGQPTLDDAALNLLSPDIEFVVPGRPGLGAATSSTSSRSRAARSRA